MATKDSRGSGPKIGIIVRVLVFLGTCALGLWVAWLILGETRIQLSVSGFITAVLVFALAQSLLGPLLERAVKRYASALLGGVGLITTFVSLWIATLFPGGLTITGVVSWILATLIVWLVTALGTWLLPLLFVRNRVKNKQASKSA